MHDFPHHYVVSAASVKGDDVSLDSPGLETIQSAGPLQFGGPGNRWSPETLLVGAVADCFILSFRAIARASKLDWISLRCDVSGRLEKADGQTRFTAFRVQARLEVPPGLREGAAQRLLEKAERSCLITNSLKAPSTLDAEIVVNEQAAA